MNTDKPRTRRFRTIDRLTGKSVWPAHQNYVEFTLDDKGNETKCELVYKNGMREEAYWTLQFALEDVNRGTIVELPVPKLRYFQGKPTHWLGESPSSLFYIETDGESVHNFVSRNGKTLPSFRWPLEQCEEKVESGIWVELPGKPAIERFFIPKPGTHPECSHYEFKEGVGFFVAKGGGRCTSAFSANELERHPDFEEVVAAPPLPASPKVRWFGPSKYFTDVSYVKFIGDKGYWHNKDGSVHESGLSIGDFINNAHFTEVFEEPKEPKVRWFLYKHIYGSPFCTHHIKCTDDRCVYVNNDGTEVESVFTAKLWANCKDSYEEVFEKPKLPAVARDMEGSLYFVQPSLSGDHTFSDEKSAIEYAKGLSPSGAFVLKIVKLVQAP